MLDTPKDGNEPKDGNAEDTKITSPSTTKATKTPKAIDSTPGNVSVVFVNTSEPLYPSTMKKEKFNVVYDEKQRTRISETTKANRRAAARQHYARRNGG